MASVPENPVLVITGTSQGLGLALAQHFSASGLRVVGCSRRESPLEHANYQHVQADISNPDELDGVFKEAKGLGNLAYLINNASMSYEKLIAFTKPSDVEAIVRTNLNATVNACQKAARLMQRKRFGRIVNISSLHVELHCVGASLYTMTKAAVEDFSKTLATEAYSAGITVNSLRLGIVSNTGMADELNQEAHKRILERTISKMPITTDDIIPAVEYLFSPGAQCVTAQTIALGA